MSSLRRHLTWIAASWALCTALAICAPVVAAAIDAAEDLCTCPGGTPGAACPMHHHNGAMPSPVSDRAHLRNACVQPDLAILSIGVGAGVLPELAAVAADVAEQPVMPIVTTPIDRSRVPDAPPPRA